VYPASFLIAYRHGRKAALQALAGFGRLPHFVLGEQPGHGATVEAWRKNSGFSFADAAAVAHAKARGFDLRSFDARQVRALRTSR
jgi:predicted nucleic acid-binding protein